MKQFAEALKDGFTHITEITDPNLLHKMREEGILIDSEGYYTRVFGDHQEYELCIEPFGEEGRYYISLYKNKILLTEKLPIWIKNES